MMKVRRLILTGFFTAALTVAGHARADDWVITTYYWDNGWIEHASWDASFLGPDLRVSFDAWNWEPEFSGFQITYDNVYMFGEIDLPQGLIDDFNDGVISQIWEGGGGVCGPGAGAAACEVDGAISIDIQPGQAWPGQNRVAWISTKNLVVHGEFDVRIDFSLNPEFHSTPNSNAKLTLSDEAVRFPEISVRTGYYQSHEVGPDYNVIIAETTTDHLAGRLRITRRKAGVIFADGFESGDTSAWTSLGVVSPTPPKRSSLRPRLAVRRPEPCFEVPDVCQLQRQETRGVGLGGVDGPVAGGLPSPPGWWVPTLPAPSADVPERAVSGVIAPPGNPRWAVSRGLVAWSQEREGEGKAAEQKHYTGRERALSRRWWLNGLCSRERQELMARSR